MTARAARFPLFDSLRAVAALSVFGFHFFYATRTLASPRGLDVPELDRFAAHLDVGVSVFFVISGFLLYRPFARARLEGEPLPSVGAYGWRRFLRIVPAYWVALTLIALWMPIAAVFQGDGPLTYYGFAQIYRPDTSLGGIAQAWTLCTEVAFYAFLPIYAVALRRLAHAEGEPRRWLRTEVIGLIALVVVSEAWKAVAISRVDAARAEAAPWLMSLPSFLDMFALGMGIAVLALAVEAGVLRPPALHRALRRPSLPWLGALAAFVTSAYVLGGPGLAGTADENGDVFLRQALYGAVGVCFVLPAVTTERGGRGLARRVLATRALLWAGLVSYGVYLWHVATSKKIMEWVGPVEGAAAWTGLLVLTTLGALLAAAVSYYVVERPALSLRGRWPRQRVDSDQPGAVSMPPLPPDR